MNMWNGYDIDMCEKIVAVEEETDKIKVISTEYLYDGKKVVDSDGNPRRDIEVVVKEGYFTEVETGE